MQDWLMYALIGAPIAIVLLIGVFEAGGWYYRMKHMHEFGHHVPDVTVASVAIQPRVRFSFRSLFKGTTMSNVVEGQTDALMIVAKNKAGRAILPLPDAAVKMSAGADSVSDVDLTTGNFVFTAGNTNGDDSLVATVAGVDSAAFVETVTPDNKVATVEIQPQPPAA